MAEDNPYNLALELIDLKAKIKEKEPEPFSGDEDVSKYNLIASKLVRIAGDSNVRHVIEFVRETEEHYEKRIEETKEYVCGELRHKIAEVERERKELQTELEYIARVLRPYI